MSNEMILIDEIKLIIDEWDPLQLLSAGYPDDEYYTDTMMIEVVVMATVDVQILAKALYRIFSIDNRSCYADKITIEDCIPIAQKLIDANIGIE